MSSRALGAVLDDVEAGNGWIVEIGGAVRDRQVAARSRRLFARVAGRPRVLHATLRGVRGVDAVLRAARADARSCSASPGSASPADVGAAPPRRSSPPRSRSSCRGCRCSASCSASICRRPPRRAAIDERFLRETLADVTPRASSSRRSGARRWRSSSRTRSSSTTRAPTCCAASRGRAARCRTSLVIARTDPASIWADRRATSVRSLAFDLLPLTDREAAEIVEIATDEHPLRPHEVEEHRAPLRRQPAVPLRAAQRGSLGRDDADAARLVEAVVAADIDRLSPSDRIAASLRLGARRDASTRSSVRAALGDEVALDEALWERLRGLVDRRCGRPACASATRSCATRPTRASPFRRRRELHARVAEAIEVGRRVARRTRRRRSRSTSSQAPAPRQGLALRPLGRRPGACGRGARRGGAVLRARAAARATRPRHRRQRSAQRCSSRWEPCARPPASSTTRSTRFVARRAPAPDDPVERARVFVQRTRARVAHGRRTRWRSARRAAGLRLVEAARRARRGRGESDSAGAAAARSACLQGHAREAIALAEAAVAEAERVRGARRARARVHRARRLVPDARRAGEGGARADGARDLHAPRRHPRLRGITGSTSASRRTPTARWAEAADAVSPSSGGLPAAPAIARHAASPQRTSASFSSAWGELDEAERVLARRAARAALDRLHPVRALRRDAARALRARARRRDDRARVADPRSAPRQRVSTTPALVLEAGSTSPTRRRRQARRSRARGLRCSGRRRREDAALYAAAVDRARAACLVALGRRDGGARASRPRGRAPPRRRVCSTSSCSPGARWRRARRGAGRGGAARDRSPRAAPRSSRSWISSVLLPVRRRPSRRRRRRSPSCGRRGTSSRSRTRSPSPEERHRVRSTVRRLQRGSRRIRRGSIRQNSHGLVRAE